MESKTTRSEVVMRLAIRVVGLGLIAAVAFVGCASGSSAPSASPSPSPTASPKPVAISIKSFAFNPATVEVAKGTTVTWTNEDPINHTVTTGTPPPSPSLSTGDGRINSGRIQATSTFSFTFNEVGTFTYFCAVHPRMVATITVK
jgi:plastocyanin